MFFHNFKYAFLTLFKNKMLIFWTFAFPIILGTFFYMAFSNIEDSEKLNLIDIAIVNNEKYASNIIFKTAFENLGNETSDNQLFVIQLITEEEAKKLLEEDKIAGYLLFQEDIPNIIIKENGINQTILKLVTEEIAETQTITQNIATTQHSIDYTSIYTKVFQLLEDNNSQIQDISSSNLSYTMIEYYTLIAMTCLYGGILGLTAINKNLANMGKIGKRVSVSPISKKTLIFSSVLASYIIQLIGLTLLFLYTIFILKVDYGPHLFQIILLALSGCLAGLSLGIALASILKCREGTKVGIVIAITMIGSFFSGMMGITMKYIIDKNIPIINKLNPASMITDGFYALYYYNTFNRFYFDIISLLLFALLLIIISIFFLRRQKYDSI